MSAASSYQRGTKGPPRFYQQTAAYFDGQTSMGALNGILAGNTTAFAVEMLVNLTSFPAAGEFRVLTKQQDISLTSPTQDFQLQLQNVNELQFAVHTVNGFAVVTTLLDSGQWLGKFVRLRAVYLGTSIVLFAAWPGSSYQLLASQDFGGGALDFSFEHYGKRGVFVIGGQPNEQRYYLQGYVLDVRVFVGQAATQPILGYTFRRLTAAQATTTAAYYELGEPAGSPTAMDYSPAEELIGYQKNAAETAYTGAIAAIATPLRIN